MRQKVIWIASGITAFLVIIGILGLLYWITNNHAAMPEALESLESDLNVQVEVEPWLVFHPAGETPSTGLIFYPGGLVDPPAYAPAGRAIAEAGTLVIIPRMPLNLAVLDVDAATAIMNAYPEVSSWVLGGHSLGGSMAALYTEQNPNRVSGLVLWASYPPDSSDLSDVNIRMTSVYGTLDGRSIPEKVLAAASRLPGDTVWVPIEGGNHAQFGWYGPQRGDNPAAIDRVDQQSKAVAATLTLLTRVDR
jgi:dienelactone hydrolase